MAIDEKNVILKFTSDTKNAEQGIKKLGEQVDGLSKTAETAKGNVGKLFGGIGAQANASVGSVGKLGGAFGSAAAQAKGVGAALKPLPAEIENSTKKVSGFQNILKQAQGVFAGLFAFDAVSKFTSGLSSLAQRTGQLAISAEQTQIAFTTFLGSAEKARDVIAQLNEFSELTPFEPEQVIKAGQSLLAFGFSAEEVIPALKSLGDLSAGTGTDFNELAEIFGKARVQGRLFGEDINQLTGRGIPIIGEFAKQFGVAESEVKKLVEQGKIGFPELEKAFNSLTSEGGKFFDLTAKQSQSLGGRISTLKGNFDALLRTIGEGLLPVFGSFVDDAGTLVQSFRKLVEVPLSDELEKERISFLGLQSELVSTNISTERRVAVIKDLIKQYPQYLGDIDAETVSNEDLNTALGKVNIALQERIRLQIQQEILTEKQDDLTDRLRIVEDKRREVLNAIGFVTSKYIKDLDLTNMSLEQQVATIQKEAEARNLSSLAIGGLLVAFEAYNGLLPGVTDRQNAYNEEEAIFKDLQEELTAGSELFAKQLEEEAKAKEAAAEAAAKLSKEEKARLKLLNEIEEANAKFTLELENELNKQIDDERKAALERARIRGEERVQAVKDAIKFSDELRQAQSIKPPDENEEFAKQEAKQLAAENRRLDAILRQTDSERNALLLADAETAKEREKIQFDYSQSLVDIEIMRLEAQLNILDLTSEEILTKEQEIENKRTQQQLDAIDFRNKRTAEAFKEIADATAQAAKFAVDKAKEATQGIINDLNLRIEAQESVVEKATKLAETGGAEALEVEERRLEQLTAARERAAERLRQITAIEVAANQAAAVANGILAVSKAFTESIPAGIAAAVSLAATIGVAVSQLNNAFGDVPAFATGTEYFDGEGTGTSDSNLARISRGERIVPADKNAKYYDTLNEFQRDTPMAKMLHNIARGNIALPMVSASKQAQGSSYDMARMERQLSGLNKRFDRLQMVVNMDSDGFSASLDKWQGKVNRRKNRIGG